MDMARTDPFERYVDRYEAWFERFPWVYRAEVRALRRLWPAGVRGVEIGVGTGRFAVPLGIDLGVEPAAAMADRARRRGIRVVAGVAESLPLASAAFDAALMVTTICFVDDVDRALAEAARILVPGGILLVGLVDRASPLGQAYEAHRQENVFYREATFYTVEEVVERMARAGFGDFAFVQTLFSPLEGVGPEEPIEAGYGRGGFVGIRGRKEK